MLEILILFMLGRNIAAKAREKGRSGAGFVVLLLVFWFGGEIAGAIFAGIAAVVALGNDEPPFLILYLGALVGAAIGAVVAFAIVGNIAPAYRRDDYGDYGDDDRYESPGRDPNRY